MKRQPSSPTVPAPSRAKPETDDLGHKLMAGAGVLAALAGSSCCLVPLVLFGVGVSGAWIGNLTRLAPYQPYFLSVAVLCIGFGYGLRRRSRRAACATGELCARTLPRRVVTVGFVVAAVLVVSALALDFLARLFY